MVDGRRRDHDLGAVRAEHRDLLLAHLVGHDEDAAVALAGRRDGEADAGVARGRLDDRPAGLELPLALGLLDHREADPVLDRAARVEVLELGEDPGVARRGEPVEPHDRRAADEVEDGRILARHRGKPRTAVDVGGLREDHRDRQRERGGRARAVVARRRPRGAGARPRGRGCVRCGRPARRGPRPRDRERARQGDRPRGQGHDRRDERGSRPERGLRVERTRDQVDRRRPDGEDVQPQLRQRLRRDRRAARAPLEPLLRGGRRARGHRAARSATRATTPSTPAGSTRRACSRTTLRSSLPSTRPGSARSSTATPLRASSESPPRAGAAPR